MYANPRRLSQQRESRTTTAKSGPLTGLACSEDNSYPGVCTYVGEGGAKNGRRLGEKSIQMPDYKGHVLSILCNDFF